jgi:hypothetical protein
MKRRELITLLGGAAAPSLLWPLAARSQQPERMRRIGLLMGAVENAQASIAAMRQALAELGWIEGRNLPDVSYGLGESVGVDAQLGGAGVQAGKEPAAIAVGWRQRESWLTGRTNFSARSRKRTASRSPSFARPTMIFATLILDGTSGSVRSNAPIVPWKASTRIFTSSGLKE